MTRTEFEAFLVRLVWRTGDTVLESDVEYLIRMGEARLNRDLMTVDRLVRTTVSGTAGVFALPADCHRIRSVSSDLSSSYHVVTTSDLDAMAAKDVTWPPAYARIADEVRTNDTEDKDYVVTYWATLPDYNDVDGETWVQTMHFDLYLHACLMQAAPYLREDDRLPIWQALYAEELESAMRDDANRTYGGSPLKARLPGIVR